MTIASLIRAIRSNWRIALSLAAIGLIAAATITAFSPRMYASSITFYVSAQGTSESAQSAYQGSLLSEQRVKSYTELLQSRRVAVEVLERLKSSDDPNQLQRNISASSQTDTVLVTATVTDQNPEQAALLANTLGGVFTDLVAEVERPVSQVGAPSVVARIVQPAVSSGSPTSPRVFLNLVLGLALGVAAGVGAAVLRSVTDRRIRSAGSVEDLVAAPFLGLTYQAATESNMVVPLRDAPASRDAEAIRKIRTNLVFLDASRPARAIVVTSPSPGEGKTTIAVNLSLALASSGARTVLVDADLRRPRVADFFDLDRTVGLTTILTRQIDLKNSVYRVRGLDVLASGNVPPNPGELLGSERMEELLRELSAKYDYIVLDSAPLLPAADSAVLSRLTDGVILVARFGKTTTTEAVGARSALEAAGANLLGYVVTGHPRVGREMQRYGYYHEAYRANEMTEAETAEAFNHVGPGDGTVRATEGVAGGRPSPFRRNSNV